MKVNLCQRGLKEELYLTKHIRMVNLIEKKVYRIGILKAQISIVPNGRVYEQVCLAECFNLPMPFVANLLIYLVIFRFVFVLPIKKTL